ncbi:MAG: carboxypeptidase regulatory-like domain-containing protein [Gemmatimonadaceae bacterium]
MRFGFLLSAILLARLAAAQTTVGGVVHDSIARAPLAGAVVQLVSADTARRESRTAMSDSLGRYTLDDVPAGRYMLGFFHDVLDSLGVEPPVRELTVDGRQPMRVDLATPSPARLRAVICGRRTVADSGAFVVGVVRDARTGAAAAGITVSTMWTEYTLSAGGVERRMPRRDAKTGQNGWFAVCNVPTAGTITLVASRGADSTDLIEVEVPPGRFLRRDLYLGPVRVITAGGAERGDSLAHPSTRRRVGDGRLTGTVIALGGAPLAGARVGIREGPETRANERGEWTLTDAPMGTRMLEVRAVGYYPEVRPVDVVAGAPPIRSTLSTLSAILDTVQVTASRVYQQYRGFEDRRRSGAGRYITPEDIARRRPVVTSDLFRHVPGVQVERGELGGAQISMRGVVSERCSPAVYVNGHNMRILDAEDIDSWVPPENITGIEIYTGASTPAEFSEGLGVEPCGSIVIWTRPGRRR